MILQTIANRVESGAVPKREQHFVEQVRFRIARDGHVLDVGERAAGIVQHRGNALRRESCPMFDPIEALFLDAADEAAVADQSGRRVTMKRIEAENVHRYR